MKRFWILSGVRVNAAINAIIAKGFDSYVTDKQMNRVEKIASKFGCTVTWH